MPVELSDRSINPKKLLAHAGQHPISHTLPSHLKKLYQDLWSKVQTASNNHSAISFTISLASLSHNCNFHISRAINQAAKGSAGTRTSRESGDRGENYTPGAAIALVICPSDTNQSETTKKKLILRLCIKQKEIDTNGEATSAEL
jgi:hypothetical protein